MEHKIFYSWQSDLPAQTNEQFIEKALKNVVQKLKDDASLDVNPILDRDIANVPGSPDVAATILAKIEQSDIFVGDVSIINKRQSRNASGAKKIRLSSNPNVLVELGYALKALGPDKIILINNLAFGRHEDLPFDFRHKLVIGYHLASNSSNEQCEEEGQFLEKQLDQKLRQIMITLNKTSSSMVTLCDQAIISIENSQPNQKMRIQHFVDWAITELENVAPPFPKVEGNEVDVLMKSIEQTVNLVFDFTKLFSAAINTDSIELPFWIYKTIFNQLLSKYYLPIGFNGTFTYTRMHFYRFVGHELFISLIALLIEAEKFEIVDNILDEALFVENTYYAGATNVSYTYISMAGESSREISYPMLEALAKRLSQHHSDGRLADLIPLKQIVDADCFLRFRKGPTKWYPITSSYLRELPKFVARAYSRKYAETLLKPLAITNIDELKSFITNWRIESLQSVGSGIPNWLINFDPHRIASQ